MEKDYRTRRKQFLDDFKVNIPKYSSNLPSDINTDNYANINTTSWFNINKYTTERTINNFNIKTEFPDEVISCQKIKMILNDRQKLILNKWFDAYTEMYNTTLDYIRNNCEVFKNDVIRRKIINIDRNKYVNMYNLRRELKSLRDDIIKRSQISTIKENTKIQVHALDYAIKQLVTNTKSALTNLRNGNIKRFRMKFWKDTRPSKTIDIEKQCIKKNVICPKILGDIKYEYNNKVYKLNNINSNVKINYNSISDEYILLVPIRNVPVKINNKPRNLITLDPGLRTFMTGLCEEDCYKIGTNVNSTVKSYIKRWNNIKNNKIIPKKIKKKNEQLINRKIYNKIDDLQWKTIKFLTSNFNNILLGDMSAKSIVAKNNSILDADSKVACLRTRYYDFQQRLQYKCMQTNTNYKLVNECYTSKTCSLCGNYNDKLKGEKIYDCNKCKKSIDRDVNGCRNIMIKCLIYS